MKPLNGHVKIDPIKVDDFVQTTNTLFQEAGTVLEIASDLTVDLPVGSVVYFDSWLAKKYPVPGTKDFTWFVKYEDITAYGSLSE